MQSSKNRLVSFVGLLLAVLASGCGGSSNSSPTPGGGGGVTTPPATTPAMSVYVINDNAAFTPVQPSTILQFAKTTSGGSLTPLSTITGPANVIFSALTEDSTGNLYVGGYTATSGTTGPGTVNLLEYAAGSSGTATPLRNLTGTGTGLEQLASNPISSIDVDSTGNLYVSAAVAVGSGPSGRIYAGISEFAPAANGNTAPVRVIAGTATTLTNPIQIAVDAAGNIFVADDPAITPPESITIFDPKAIGNAAPTAILGGSNTQIYYVRGVAVDTVGNIYVASLAQPAATNAPTFGGTPSILVFAAGATGNVAPTRVITGTSTSLGSGVIHNLRVDSAGNIYILSGTSILKFASGATGNVAPAETIASPAFFTIDSSLAVQ